ncbi:MAG: FliM/FliN family flagellar motor switch protein [Actinomycetota bacterium]|nr:FliM/FliN family flagellar motor switch protein [Actinomycetota bacterium]
MSVEDGDDLLVATRPTGTPVIPSLPGEPDGSAQLRVVEPAPQPGAPNDVSRAGRMPIEALGDVELKVEVVLGRARLRLQELLDVRPGQAVELDRARNAPVDVLVNGMLFARGEIVVIDDTNLGVRVSEVVGSDPKEA